MYNAKFDKEDNGIGKRIAAARKLKKITAQQLCDKLEQYGMWYGIIKVFQLRNCTV